MSPPITRLPPELLASVFEHLASEERTLIAMASPYWYELVKGLWPALKTKPNKLLDWAAETGSLSLMKRSKKWGATDFDRALRGAAYGGHIDGMKLAKKWGATDFGEAMVCAACGGQVESLKHLKKWGATCFLGAAKAAASQWQFESVRLLEEWDVESIM